MKRGIADFVFVAIWVASYVVVYYLVEQQKTAHIRRQNGLLETCRAMYIIASQHIAEGDKAAAEALLSRIRAIESRWKVGNSQPLRWAVTLKSIALATIAVACLRILPVPFMVSGSEPLWQNILSQFKGEAINVAWVFLGPPLIHALLASWLTPWHELHIIDDVGDRLEKMLRAGSAVAQPHKTRRRAGMGSDGLSDLELLGLPAIHTKSELRAARNRMAARFHPDFAADGNLSEQARMTTAMQRINAAYDRLSKALDS